MARTVSVTIAVMRMTCEVAHLLEVEQVASRGFVSAMPSASRVACPRRRRRAYHWAAPARRPAPSRTGL